MHKKKIEEKENRRPVLLKKFHQENYEIKVRQSPFTVYNNGV